MRKFTILFRRMILSIEIFLVFLGEDLLLIHFLRY